MANSPGTVLRKHFESDPVLQGFEDGTLSWGNHMQQEEDRLESERTARHARGVYTPRAVSPDSPPRQTVPAYLPARGQTRRAAPAPPQRRPFGFQPRGYRQGPNSVPQWLRAPPPGYSRRRSPSRSPPRYYSRRRSPSRSPPRYYSRRRSPSRSPSRGRYSRRSPSRSPPRYSRRRSPSRSSSRGRSRRRSHSRARSVNSFGRRLSYSPPRRTNTARRGRGPRFFNQATGTYRSLSPSPTRE